MRNLKQSSLINSYVYLIVINIYNSLWWVKYNIFIIKSYITVQNKIVRKMALVYYCEYTVIL